MSLIPFFALTATLAAVSVTDIRGRIIPNRALLAAVGLWVVNATASGGEGTASAVIAAVVIASPLLVAALIRPEGMGMGDAKLVAVIGLFLGWQALSALLLGLALAGMTGVLMALGRRVPPSRVSLPLAPFLAAGVLPVALLGLQALQ